MPDREPFLTRPMEWVLLACIFAGLVDLVLVH